MPHHRTRRNSLAPAGRHGHTGCGWSGEEIGYSRKRARRIWKMYLKKRAYKDEE